MWFLPLCRYSWRQWNHERQIRLLKCRTKGCMSDSPCWLTLHAEHAAKQRLEKHGSDSLLIPFQWLQPSRFHQSKMILLRTHLLHALEWLSIRIQLPKDDPLRNHLLRFIFFPQWVFHLICLYNIFKDKDHTILFWRILCRNLLCGSQDFASVFKVYVPTWFLWSNYFLDLFVSEFSSIDRELRVIISF